NRAHACDELAGRKGLCHVVVRAQFEADDPIDLLVARGQDQNRYRSAGPQLSADLETVEVGQCEVEDDDPGVEPLDSVKSSLAGLFADDPEAGPFEIGGHERTDYFVVFDHDRDASHGRNALTAVTICLLWSTTATSPRRS